MHNHGDPDEPRDWTLQTPSQVGRHHLEGWGNGEISLDEHNEPFGLPCLVFLDPFLQRFYAEISSFKVNSSNLWEVESEKACAELGQQL